LPFEKERCEILCERRPAMEETHDNTFEVNWEPVEEETPATSNVSDSRVETAPSP
jgi:hypothetical protein